MAVRANIRPAGFVLVLLSGIVATLLYIPPMPTLTKEKGISGNLTFTDRTGNPLFGTMEIIIDGVRSGLKSNVDSISWTDAPGVRIYFSALKTKNLSVNFSIAGDSPEGRVWLEDFGTSMPENVNIQAPGVPVRYVEINATGVSFVEADLFIQNTDSELKGRDENSLAIYRYDRAAQAWEELPASTDAASNKLGVAVNSLSVFAVSARAGAPFNRELEIDEIKTKGLAVRLKVNKQGGGEIILEDYGKRNPVTVAPPGNAIKFVDISAANISFDSADVRIHYTDDELGGADESALVIYHWNGVAWDALPTTVDAANNVLTATTNSLSPFAVLWGTGGNARIHVATNRYVILDDWRTGGALGPGFSNPGANHSSQNSFTGINTKINATALFIDDAGSPLNGRIITFNLYMPNGTEFASARVNATTNAYGLANFSFDMDQRNYYGNWTVMASNGSLNDSTGFIYNWWGCGTSSSSCTGGSHGSKNPSGTQTINSPYLRGRESPSWGDHSGITNCTNCHQSFDGKPGGNTLDGANHTNNPSDVHRNVSCNNTNCHQLVSTHNTNAVIGSCYNSSGCHTPANRSDTSNKTTLNNSNKAIAHSEYSENNGTDFNGTFHTPNSTVPCIICHGPMHNISKPDNTLRFTRNNYTEDTHCATCHSSQKQHNGTVNCTLCHSDDVHYIQVFSRNSTGGAQYVNVTGLGNPPSNCTLCHQNGTYFFNSLENLSDAGNYTKRRDPPQVAVQVVTYAPMEHSNDTSAGTKWNQTQGYWNSSIQYTWCTYCHGNTTHYDVALGRLSLFDGVNTVNSSISLTSSWCSSCHWQGYSNGSSTYKDMIATYDYPAENLLVPPEITGNATYGANQSSSWYFNHSDLSIKSDISCNGCHGGFVIPSNMTALMHNVTIGYIGSDCIGCHDYGKTNSKALHRINNSAMNSSSAMHRNLNSNATNSSNVSAENKKCWGCHTSNGTEPGSNRTEPWNYFDMGDRFANPYTCYDCHNSTNKPYANVSSALEVSEHFRSGARIRAASTASDNSSSCLVCHNLTEMNVSYTEDDIYSSTYSLVSHYGRNRTDLRIWNSNRTDNCSYCHQNVSTAFAVAMVDAAYNRSIQNHSTSNAPNCFNATCHDTGWLHNSSLTRPPLPLPNSTYCQNCHTDKQKHNGTQDCSNCHINQSSNDTIHPIKYIQSNGSFAATNTSAVDCIDCHQTGLASFSSAPKIPGSLYHSDNASNGTIWNSTAYWTPNSTITACIYCHNDTKHNATALGRPANWRGNNAVNSSINASNWCASCHYRGYSSGGKNYSDMTSTFASANLPVPPEITNGTYALNIYDRSGYYNHSLKDYSDATCRLCHGINISSNASITAFVHNITWGSCTGCHYSFDAMNSTNRPDRFVDSAMYNTSLHRSLSCEKCHTKGHKNIGARKACEDCHAIQQSPITDKDRHNITTTPSTYSYNGTAVVNITDCTTCHNSTLYNKATATYGYGKPKDCDYCHTYSDKYYE